MFYEFFTHTDTGVFDRKFIIRTSLRSAWLLRDPQAYDTACSGILHCVTQQIQKHLVKPQLVAEDLLIEDIYRINI